MPRRNRLRELDSKPYRGTTRYGGHKDNALVFDETAHGDWSQRDARASRQLGLPYFGRAGALRSSVNDMLTFLEAFPRQYKNLRSPAMKTMFEVRRPVAKIGLGWFVSSVHDRELAGHDGGTGGFARGPAAIQQSVSGSWCWPMPPPPSVSLISGCISLTRRGCLSIQSLRRSTSRFRVEPELPRQLHRTLS